MIDRVQDAIQPQNHSTHVEKAYVNWVKPYICFHNVCHPVEMGSDEIEAFLTPWL